jgi:adenylate kinase family enzyme
MDRTIEKTITGGTIRTHAAKLVVELVGPAGAGKTTLAKTLVQRNNRIHACTPPYFRRIENLPFFVKSTLLFLPAFIHLLYDSHGRRLTPREIVWLVTLTGWHHWFGRRSFTDNKIVILDQGPVFMLADLYGFGSQDLMNKKVRNWWNSLFKQWADTLDMVIWLDATDQILMERIRSRDKWHLVKDRSDAEMVKFLGDYRESFNKVLSLLVANRAELKVIRFDTEQESLDSVVDKLLVVFGLDEFAVEFVRDGSVEPVYDKL